MNPVLKDPLCSQRSQGRPATVSVYTCFKEFKAFFFAQLFLAELLIAGLTVYSCQCSLISQESALLVFV